jgi:hypothetical protein
VLLPGELHYTHTTFLTTLTTAFSDALKAAASRETDRLSAEERTAIVPEYYVEASRSALRQVLEQQYSTGQTTDTAQHTDGRRKQGHTAQ